MDIDYDKIHSAKDRVRIWLNTTPDMRRHCNTRVVSTIWKHMLLTKEDNIMYNGRIYPIVAEHIALDVYELTAPEAIDGN
jgi:hypothetical protein